MKKERRKKIGYSLIFAGIINLFLTLGLIGNDLITLRIILFNISFLITMIGCFLTVDMKNKYKYFKKKFKKSYRWEGWKKESKNLTTSVYAFIKAFSEWLDNQWIEFKKTLLDDLGDIILMIIISTICLFFIKEIPSTRVPMLIVMLFVSIFAVSHCFKKMFKWGVINVINVFLLIMILISIIYIVNNHIMKLLISIFLLWIVLLFCKKGLEEAGLYPEIFIEISRWFKRKGKQ